MEEIFQILLNALPEAIGGLIAAGIIALLSYLFVKRLRKETPQDKAPQELPHEPALPEIYSNLPSRTEFIGRKKEMERVKAALNSRYFLICIDGIGGIGKTSLALEVIYECLRFSKGEIAIETEKQTESAIPKFDGFIWTSAKDRELRLNDILDAIARTLDWPGIAQQPYEEKIESVRKLLQTKRYLLIVDNFETITDEAVRDFLLKIPEPSKVLITSREQKLPQAWAVSIKGLEQDEALALIRNEGQRLGLKSVEEADDQVLLRLYQATGGAPLAIKWSVGQIKQKGQSLDTVLAALHEAMGDIFEQVFARSWSLLSEDAQKVLMVMPIFAASASRDAIEAASDVHHFALDEALGQLVQMWLVEVTDELEAAKRRYSVHPLTRAFGEKKLKGDIWVERGSRLRVARYFLKFIKNLVGLDYWQGLARFKNYYILEEETNNILKIIDWCFLNRKWRATIKFIFGLVHFWGLYGYWQIKIENVKKAILASKELNDWNTESLLLIDALGWIYLYRNNLVEAESVINEGYSIAKLNNIKDLISLSKYYFGALAIKKGDLVTAEKELNEAILISNDQRTKSRIKAYLGYIAYQRKEYSKAQTYLEQALELRQDLGELPAVCGILAILGDIAHETGNKKKARFLYEQSLKQSMEIPHLASMALAKKRLAMIDEHEGEYNRALKQAFEALEILKKLEMKKELDELNIIIERLKVII